MVEYNQIYPLRSFHQNNRQAFSLRQEILLLDQFKFLRDGGDYVEEETGQTKHFDGQLFDSVVFELIQCDTCHFQKYFIRNDGIKGC